MAKLSNTALVCIGATALVAASLVNAAPVMSNEIQTPYSSNIRYNNLPEHQETLMNDKHFEYYDKVPQKKVYRSYDHESEESSHEHPHHSHSDHVSPQQTYGGSPIIGLPLNGYGIGKESITAIAANSAGTSASAKIGLVSLAGIIGATALF